MPETFLDHVDLDAIARRVGTPFYVYSADVLRRRIADVRAIAPGGCVQARYAMKACSTRRLLEIVREAGLWIDAVSGNEVLRAHAAGFRDRRTPRRSSCSPPTCSATTRSRSCCSTASCPTSARRR